ncbi:solute carrier family 35 member B1-like [Exaiptasia diaphana]|uniref:Solute carrier family 35 member B1 n=1 Tax=Exaiptasia diaphana TaxID=2652724 RepID=A0A913WNW5_EXADI|nr:solute carrier family 35 member B1-like [Exaiptasia diaphana]
MITVKIDTGKEPITKDMTSTSFTHRFKFLICFLGIFVSYFYYGIIQEKITRAPYGENKEKFVFALTLVFVQCIVNALFAKAVVKLTYTNEEKRDSTPMLWYGACAFTYLSAMLASNKALQWVSYPTQVLGKSCKPIPVMILGVLLARKRYPLVKYLCVFLIVAGVALFMYKEKPSAAQGGGMFSIAFGELLLLVSLTCDGLTGAIQDRMRGEHHVQSHHMMFNMNLWSIGILGLSIVTTGELFAFVTFCEKYPYVLAYMLTFSCASAIGQNFIFMTVANFGPLSCSIITTTRKFFTILGSVILFGNVLTGRQWIGVVCVFIGLGADSILSKSGKKKH